MFAFRLLGQRVIQTGLFKHSVTLYNTLSENVSISIDQPRMSHEFKWSSIKLCQLKCFFSKCAEPEAQSAYIQKKTKATKLKQHHRPLNVVL